MGVIMMAATLWAQQQKLNRDPQYIVDPTAIMRILTPQPELEGTVLMNQEWQKAAVFLSNGKQGTILEVNYDLQNNLVPVLYNNEEYSINGITVDSMLFQQTQEVLISETTIEGVEGDQLLVRLYDGPGYALYKKTLIDIIKPNYNEILNVGSRNYKVDKIYKYIFHSKVDEKAYNFNNKKDLKALPEYSQLEAFLKQNKPAMKQESDLVNIAKAYQKIHQ